MQNNSVGRLYQSHSGLLICLLIPLLVAVSGCEQKQSGPPSTRQTSAEIPVFSDRVRFLEAYVAFERTYRQLEFDIFFQNNSGGLVSGPSDWDVQLVAVVPADEIDLWVSDNMQLTQPGDWPQRVASEIDVSGIEQWYRAGGKVVGLDRRNSIVVYRINTMGN